MYKNLYDDDHKMVRVQVQSGNLRKSRPSKGEYEGGLLCADCDGGVIGKLETYGRDVLMGYDGRFKPKEKRTVYKSDGLKLGQVDVNYAKFKLFLLSILWRAGISKRDQFKSVQLSPQVSEELRRMILDGDAGEEERFPCLLVNCIEDKPEDSDIISPPFPLYNGLGFVLVESRI